jgi:hypothetical protein
MLTIRSEQLRTLEAVARDRFVDTVTLHLRTHFTETVQGMGETELRAIVLRAVERAATYGLTSEQDALRYVNLAAAYGWEFDRDPRHDWMRQMLTSPAITSPSERLRLLVDRCLEHARRDENTRRLAEEFGLQPGKGQAV